MVGGNEGRGAGGGSLEEFIVFKPRTGRELRADERRSPDGGRCRTKSGVS
jgi:hypothetical protein